MKGRIVWVVSMSVDIDQEFRDVIHKTRGSKRGNLRDSVEEAIQEWIRKKNQELMILGHT